MARRLIAAVLWFYAAGAATNVVVLVLDGPSVASAVVGAAAAAFIGLDPLRVIWAGARPVADGANAAERAGQRALRGNL